MKRSWKSSLGYYNSLNELLKKEMVIRHKSSILIIKIIIIVKITFFV